MEPLDFENSDPELDNLLSMLPGAEAPPDLAGKIRLAMQSRRQRTERFRMGFSLVLAVLGTWLALPGLFSQFGQLEIPQSGLPVLLQAVTMLLAGLGGWLTGLLQGLSTFQSSYVQSMAPNSWIGLTALAFACLLGVSSLLTGYES